MFAVMFYRIVARTIELRASDTVEEEASIDNLEVNDAKVTVGRKFRGFFCDICGIPAEREGLKEWHTGGVHVNTMEVVCQHCDEELLDKVKLQQHMK
jgi:hypothetical protein